MGTPGIHCLPRDLVADVGTSEPHLPRSCPSLVVCALWRLISTNSYHARGSQPQSDPPTGSHAFFNSAPGVDAALLLIWETQMDRFCHGGILPVFTFPGSSYPTRPSPILHPGLAYPPLLVLFSVLPLRPSRWRPPVLFQTLCYMYPCSVILFFAPVACMIFHLDLRRDTVPVSSLP